MKKRMSDIKMKDVRRISKEPTLEEIEEMEYRRDNPTHRIDEPKFKLDWLPNPDNISKKYS